MLSFLQPLFAALIGAAVCVFGLFHTIQLWPDVTIWHQVVVTAPQILAVLLVVMCLALVMAGLVMVTRGVKAARRRFAMLRRCHWETEPRYEDREDPWQ